MDESALNTPYDAVAQQEARRRKMETERIRMSDGSIIYTHNTCGVQYGTGLMGQYKQVMANNKGVLTWVGVSQEEYELSKNGFFVPVEPDPNAPIRLPAD